VIRLNSFRKKNMKNREIKFRVWNHGDDRGGKTGMYYYDLEFAARCYKHPEYYTLQQFTGILDKNSREIYEGDIIKAEYKEKGNFIVGEIKFGSGGFFINKYDYLWFGVKNDVYEDGEVVGNIFENPELLNKE
jgi:uncharacterized phage protein (TIGR01671 family)